MVGPAPFSEAQPEADGSPSPQAPSRKPPSLCASRPHSRPNRLVSALKSANRWAHRQRQVPERGRIPMMRTGSKRYLLQLALGLGVLALTTAARAEDDGRKLVEDAVNALPKAAFVAK